jgi:hypothetical protein
MSTDERKEARTTVAQRYAGSSAVTDTVRLVADRRRSPVRVQGTVRDPIPFREALSVLHGIVASDLRYTPKDRTAYVAWRRMKAQNSGVGARAAYFDWLARNDPMAWFVLDPVVTVNPDAVLFEVFSKDEGSYAQLSVAHAALDLDGEVTCGTTNIDFSDALLDGVQTIRSWRPLALTLAPDAVTLTTEEAVVEKTVAVPDGWIRGFLQVASSASLTRAVVHLEPIQLYNIVRQLRLQADEKRKGRAIRVELVPGECPRLVLEPWETVLETEVPYAGPRPEIVRIWGRRRWSLLRRFLPFVQGVELHLLGSGMPSFLVLRAGPLTLTLGLTGFTAANWSQALAFDALMPRADAEGKVPEAILTHLGETWSASRADLAKATGASAEEVHAALQALALQGAVAIDLAADVVRLRPLTADPIPAERLRYRTAAERTAYSLVDAKAVDLTTENVVHGTGTELVAKVKADQRVYRTSFVLDPEGRVRNASCTCPQFRDHKLKEGPCPHLLALRIRYEQLRQHRAERRGTALRSETRTYARRTDAGEAVTQLSLDERRLKIRWGLRSDPRLRRQSLVFDTVDEARTAYLERIAGLEARGYLDASAS